MGRLRVGGSIVVTSVRGCSRYRTESAKCGRWCYAFGKSRHARQAPSLRVALSTVLLRIQPTEPINHG